MKPSHMIAMLLIAGAIAITVSTVLAPRVATEPDEAPAINTVTTEPQPAPNETRRSAQLSVRDDGHYWARALVNNKASIEFMVDTGASVIALTYADAQKMGLEPNTLDYSWKISTAGGETMGASVLIDSIKINQVHIRDVEAMVLKTDLEQSLLGMSFLSKLYSYEFRGERLIIRQ